MKIRRAASIVCLWDGHLLELAIPGSATRYRVSWNILHLLSQLDDWTDQTEIIENSDGDGKQVEEQLIFLQCAGLIERSGSAVESVDDAWQHWGPVARYFHSITRDAHYPESPEEREILAAAIASSQPPPNIFKTYSDRPVLFLPRALRRLNMTVEEAFQQRRTHRDFTDDPVDCETFSTILHYTFAPQRFADGLLFGTQQMRVSPAAGGRHEVECYVVPLNVVGVPTGLYHYDPQRHALELLRESFTSEDVAAVTYGQPQLRTAAFVCFTTAVAERLAWKYRHPRAYRLWMYDAGHYGQTFALACTAMELGPFQTAAFLDSKLEHEIGLNSDVEFGAYVLAAGHPITGRHGEPASFTYPVPDMLK